MRGEGNNILRKDCVRRKGTSLSAASPYLSSDELFFDYLISEFVWSEVVM